MLESLDLTQLGLSGTLHLTLAYVQGVGARRGGAADAGGHHDQMSCNPWPDGRAALRTVCDGAISPSAAPRSPTAVDRGDALPYALYGNDSKPHGSRASALPIRSDTSRPLPGSRRKRPYRLARQPRAVCIVRQNRSRPSSAWAAICSASTARSTISTIAARAGPRRPSSPNISTAASPNKSSSLRRQNRFKQERSRRHSPGPHPYRRRFRRDRARQHSRRHGLSSARMTEAYCRLGIESVGGDDGIPSGFRRDAALRNRRRTSDRGDRRLRRIRRLSQRDGLARRGAPPLGSGRRVAARARKRSPSARRGSSFATRTAAKCGSTRSIATSSSSISSTFPNKS